MNPSPLLWFWVVLRATLLSTGGFGNLPALHHETVTARAWISEARFAEALALGQVCPGPNGLWVVCLGTLLGGVWGGILAAFALCLPPLLVVPVEWLYTRAKHLPTVQGFVTGIGLTVTGIGVVVLCRVFAGSGSVSVKRVAVALFGAGLMAWGRVPFLAVLLIAALLGVFLR